MDERLKLVLLVTAFIIGFLFLWFALDIILLVFAAVLVAILLSSIARYFTKYTKIRGGFAVISVVLLLMLVLSLVGWLLAPAINDQIDVIQHQLPQSMTELSKVVAKYPWGEQLQSEIISIKNTIQGDSRYVQQALGVFSSVLGTIVSIAAVLLMGLFLAIEPKMYQSGVVKLFPRKRRARIREVLDATASTLRWWFLGKGISMLVVGVLTTIGLLILDVPLAITLGILAGLLSFIPNFGPIISAVPAILLGLLESPTKALYVALMFVGVQVIESNLITPFVERKTIYLPPALTLTAQIFMGLVAGTVGVILATPIVAVVVVWVKMLYVEDVLGDRIKLRGDNDAPMPRIAK